MFRLLLISSLACSLLFMGGCASKKKETTDETVSLEGTDSAESIDGEGAVAVDEGMGAVEVSGNLEVNSSSDQMTAGALKTVNFGFNSNALSAGAMAILDGNAAFLSSTTGISVQIEGHCDERGSIEYNLALGQRRAESVRNYLVDKGIKADRLTTISFGKDRPLAFESNEAAWSQNRRANFVVTTTTSETATITSN